MNGFFVKSIAGLAFGVAAGLALGLVTGLAVGTTIPVGNAGLGLGGAAGPPGDAVAVNGAGLPHDATIAANATAASNRFEMPAWRVERLVWKWSVRWGFEAFIVRDPTMAAAARNPDEGTA